VYSSRPLPPLARYGHRYPIENTRKGAAPMYIGVGSVLVIILIVILLLILL
jgi:hypothetical protein